MNTYRKVLLALFVLAIGLSAISPESYGNWFLEISPVFIAVPFIVYLGRRFGFSDASYTLILIYLLLPIIQAHYGVANVPFGFILAKWENIDGRNMFDRLTHFSFGLLLFYPLLEIFKKSLSHHNFLKYFVPASVIMAFASFYEVIELVVRQLASPHLAFLFIAAQADFWDTSKDIANTLEGLAIALAITLLVEKLLKIKNTK
jgi:putative membrane protein